MSATSSGVRHNSTCQHNVPFRAASTRLDYCGADSDHGTFRPDSQLGCRQSGTVNFGLVEWATVIMAQFDFASFTNISFLKKV
jgi:hypothetical protein